MAMIRRPRDGALLVSEHANPVRAPFHRALGGHLEFGEKIFQWNAATQHEIVFMFAAAFADLAAYEIAEQYILDQVDIPTRVSWRARGTASPPLYPAGAELLLGGPAPGTHGGRMSGIMSECLPDA